MVKLDDRLSCELNDSVNLKKIHDTKSELEYMIESIEHLIQVKSNEIKDTNCCLNHWIDGSFVTLKENPDDIDTLTEFDGVKIEKLGIRNNVENIIYNAPLRTGNYCHSFAVFKFPESQKKDYEEYLDVKSKILYLLFPFNQNTNTLKGFVKLIKVS